MSYIFSTPHLSFNYSVPVLQMNNAGMVDLWVVDP